ncbi:Uncharacterized protein TCM_014933 [Theobroma cacao]|uniref:DUF7610 domain-containing protein n=1 Tax=Theobroma cacao TaxID=3641 RepID=A0A061G771_THECC|nr:Uncharacterized protein TCM_014933 [Theobroma cacao]
MTKKSFTILQKKLKELESELNQVFALPPETPHHKSFSQDIQQRFLFLKNLLSAEIASRPGKPYLQHIAQRFLELESAFQDWDSFQASAPDHIEKGSTCSCTDSCLNDDGEAAEGSLELSLADMEEVAEPSAELSLAGWDLEGSDEERMVTVPVLENLETARVSEAESERRNEEERVWVEAERSMRKEETNRVWFGKYLRTLASGVVLGMVMMGCLMVRLSGCFHYASDYTFRLSPT